jgi:hypothetical protein
VPWPLAPTHASGGKLYGRTHHLIKTFHSGWIEQQLPDGTIVLTTPTGHTYTTEPRGASMFPTLAQSTGELPVPTRDEPSRYRDVMMPRRTHPRTKPPRPHHRRTPPAHRHSSPKKNDTAKPGSPPTTNHHRFDAVAMFSATGLSP